jgi:hypothetical protein
VLAALQVAAFYEHANAREYETLLAEATDPQLEDERLIQVPAAAPGADTLRDAVNWKHIV